MAKKYFKFHEEHAVTPLTISPNHNGWPAKILVKLIDGLRVGKRTFCTHQDHGLAFYADYKMWDKGSSHLLGKIKKNPKFVSFIEKKHKEIGGKLLRIIQKTESIDWQKLNNQQSASLLLRTYKLANDFCAYGYVPVLSDIFFQKLTTELKKIVNKALKKKSLNLSVPELVTLLSSPTEVIPSRQARFGFLKIILSIRKFKLKEKWEEILSRYYGKWYWVNFGHLGPGLTRNEMRKNIRNLLAQKLKTEKEFYNLKNYGISLNKKQEALFKKLELAKEEIYLFKTSQEFMYLKGYRMEILFGVYALWSRILEVFSKRINVPKDLFYYCSVEEIIKWLKGGRGVSLKILKERSKFCVWEAISETKQQILIGRAARNYLKNHAQEESRELKNVLVIHGTVASLGYAKGAVKIVNKISDIKKVQGGDILVSVATNPSLLPAMKKAVAFVTDAGGITSHAAIVARELKKPCIIGTKFATKILKDGDRVELDTKKGDIRRLAGK